MGDDVTKPTFFRRATRALLNATFTLGILGGSGLAVVVGADLLGQRAEASAPVETADKIPVSVSPLTIANGYTLPRQFIGQVESLASVALSFELGGRLDALLVDEGAEVKKGDLLARLDTALLEAERNRLQASRAATAAQLEFAESRLSRAMALREDGFASQEAVDQALASRDELANRIRETDAAINAVAINIQKSELFAPFDGRVGARGVDGGETLGAGAPVLTLIQTAAPQIRVGLPLSVDTAALQNAVVAINGIQYPATLTQIRPDIDPATRTRTALFAIDADAPPTFGQIATLALDMTVEAAGTWVPLDALQEGLGSVWTILVVDEGIVRQAAVEILHSDATRAYVRGTFPDGAQMIRTGAHRVVPGQQVRILSAGG